MKGIFTLCANLQAVSAEGIKLERVTDRGNTLRLTTACRPQTWLSALRRTDRTKDATDDIFADDWFPIQVKQTDKVGRPDIDAFEAVMEREGQGGRQRGFYVSFGYTKDAESECAAFHKRTGRIIKLLTVQEILDEEFVQKM